MASGKGRNWYQQHVSDPYVREAQQGNYRSRAVFKLRDIDKSDRLFGKTVNVLDLGAAPGGWSQYAIERLKGRGRVVAIDRLPMDPIDGVEFIQGDITDPDVMKDLTARLGDHAVDLMISDMAPDISGIKATDAARFEALWEAIDYCIGESLAPKGRLVMKLFQGLGDDRIRQQMKQRFRKVTVRKPDASRDRSREYYVVAER